MRISENFNLREFVAEGRDITPIQAFMLQNLCIKILEPIRAFLNCPMAITSGMRFPSDINRLRKSGYNPSETSDHLFGNLVRVSSLKKKAIYGNYYSFSVGACDTVPSCGALQAWNKLKPYFDIANGIINLPVRNSIHPIKIGQLILEQNENGHWLHISNSQSILYSDAFIAKYLKKIPFLISEDNGKTYNIYKE